MLGLLGSGSVATSTFSTDTIEHTETTILIKNLPLEFQDYRIGFLSDIHLGAFVPDDWLDHAISSLNRAGIDLLTLGGDYLWIPDTLLSGMFGRIRNEKFSNPLSQDLPDRIYSRVGAITSQIQSRDGIFAVLGNHDRWVAPLICLKSFKEQKIPVLVNETVQIKRDNATLQIAGVDDYWRGIPRNPFGAEEFRPNTFRVLLAHNPDYISGLIASGQAHFDLALAGHTHGGQIKLPFVGALTYNIQDQRFSSGLKQLEGLSVYTTRGLGVVEIPYRINCPAEASVLTLKRA